MLSQHVQRRYALELLGDHPGGVGYLLKQRVGDMASFGHALRRVADGGTALDPEVVAMMLQMPRTTGELQGLSARRLGLTPDEDDHRRVLAVVRYLAGRA